MCFFGWPRPWSSAIAAAVAQFVGKKGPPRSVGRSLCRSIGSKGKSKQLTFQKPTSENAALSVLMSK